MKINVTITLYLEVKDAALFGGMGKVGYARSNLILKQTTCPLLTLRLLGNARFKNTRNFSRPQKKIYA